MQKHSVLIALILLFGILFSLYASGEEVIGQTYKVLFYPAVQEKNQLFEGDAVKFSMYGSDYLLVLKQVDEQNVEVTLSLRGETEMLGLGDGAVFDLNNNQEGDLKVNFTNFNLGEITLRLESLEDMELSVEELSGNEDDIEDAVLGANEKTGKAEEFNETSTGFVVGALDRVGSSNLGYLITALVVAALVFGFIKRRAVLNFLKFCLKIFSGMFRKIFKKRLNAPLAPRIMDSVTCKKCGRSISARDKFCLNCGAKVVKEHQKKICSSCRTQLKPGSKFCSYCGKVVG